MNLKDLRKQKGMTQKQVAKEAGVSISAYQGYEKGSVYPNIKVIEKIAAALDEDVSVLTPFLLPVNNTMEYACDGTEAKLSTNNALQKKKLDKHNNDELSSLFEYYLKLNHSGREALLERTAEMVLLEKYTRPETKDGETLPIPIHIE